MTNYEQERAYLMLRMTSEGSDFGSWEAGSYVLDDEDGFGDPHDHTESDGDDDEFDGTDVNDEDDVFDVHAHEDGGEHNNSNFELDPGNFSSDEAYARALQDAEDREMAARLLALAGLQDREYAWPCGSPCNTLLLKWMFLNHVRLKYLVSHVTDDADDTDDQGENSQVFFFL